MCGVSAQAVEHHNGGLRIVEPVGSYSIWGNSIDALVPRLRLRRGARRLVERFWLESPPVGYGQAWGNIGCGPDIRLGGSWVNYDKYPSHDKVVELDLTKTPWPMRTGGHSRILADQVFEHLPHFAHDGRDAVIAALCEVGRILAPGGRAIIGTPDAWGWDAWSNVTHYRGFNERTIQSCLASPVEGEAVANHAMGVPDLFQRGVVLARRGKLLGVDSSYHFPKYLGFEPNLGRRWMIYYLLEKPRVADDGY